MSELPERRVLKEVLANLKSKSLSSNEIRKTHVDSLIKELKGAEQQLVKLTHEKPNDSRGLWLLSLIQQIHSMVQQVILRSDTATSDMEIYIDALERYSINLDRTLSEIFEGAKKHAEEQIKQQEEQMKKGSTGYIK